MKKGAAIINLARGELIENAAVIEAVTSGKLSRYVTDFPADELIGVPGIIVMPHLGASTPEAEDNCAVMAASELKDFLEDGNIRNSVNFPACMAPRAGKSRITVIHKNEKSVISAITDVIGKANINIENFVSRSRGDFAYAIVDTTEELKAEVIDNIKSLPSVIRCRVL